MFYIEFARGPNNWVGMVNYNDGHEFASGRTMDKLVFNMKARLYSYHKVSGYQVMLDTKQTNYDEFIEKYSKYMTTMFRTKYAKPSVEVLTAPKIAPKPVVHEHITEMVGDEMVVYELREIARYKLHGATKTETVDKNIDTDIPVCTDDCESQD